MSDFILKRNLSDNFTQISNEFLHDNSISILARGIGTFLLSKPNNWVINQENICKELEIGRDKLKKIFNELIIHGYMHRCRYITFAKKNEQSVFYYISDSKEHLYKEVVSRDIKNTDSISNQNTLSPFTENPLPNSSYKKNPTDNIININNNLSFKNKDINKKENNNIDPLLLDFLNIHLDEVTKNNVLKISPHITLEDFKTIFEKCKTEYKLGYSKNLNSTLILALKKEWRFQTSEKIERDKRVFNSKIRYFKDLYLETRESHEEIINKFRNDCIKSYTKDIIDEYEAVLKKELESLII
ncbi:hypothetical protein [Cetobacterium sp. 2G large]|uniref:hypothetical protein n=1 Tax=Cetobacterium sp. 2G large TaxID=2759680 RepID=UPI00163C8318|nr:hypothetical protein [Cetobacterium sp. 2G large]MBC2853653.1 hypothetical protein [Cetobacterium sp. 2G large]